VGRVRSVQFDRETPPLASLGLIAGDGMNAGLVHLVRCHGSLLGGCRLVANHAIGESLRRWGFDVDLVVGSPPEADAEIGARVFNGSIDGLIFLPDAATEHNEVDVQLVVRACDAHGVPVATSLASARYLLIFLAQRIRRAIETRSLHPAGDR
jgi:methylglyoxal synthase